MSTALTNSAYGLDIIIEGDPPHGCADSGLSFDDDDFTALVDQARNAASFWERIIKDDHTLTINIRWEALPSGKWGVAGSAVFDSNNRIIEGNIAIDSRLPDPTGTWESCQPETYVGPERTWYMSTPDDDNEFSLSSTLYGGETAWFNGAPPSVLEIGMQGPAVVGGAADGQPDLLSVLKHEIGHLLSATPIAAADAAVDNDFDVSPNLVGGNTVGIVQNAANINHLLAGPALMQSGYVAGTRELISVTDALYIATASNWTQIDIPRKYFVGGTNFDWNTPENWVGNRVPSAADDAFLRSPDSDPMVELVATGNAGNLFIGEGDDLSTNAFTLNVVDTVAIDGLNTALFVDTGGQLEAVGVVVQNNGTLLVDGGHVIAETLDINSGSFVTGGSAGGAVAIADSLVNDGTIHSTGGTLIVGGTGAHWDLDGADGNGVVSAASGDLVFQFLTPVADSFGGTMVVGEDHWLASMQPIVVNASGRIQLDGGPTTSDLANLNVHTTLASSAASIDVTGNARLHASTTIHAGTVNLAANADLEFGQAIVSGGQFDVATGALIRFDSMTELSGGSFSTAGTGSVRLNGPTDYRGGTLSVVGRVHQDGEATLSAPTTINGSGSWDLDGNGGSTVWNVNDDFTINAVRIENSSNHQFDGRINLNGSGTTMTVNTTAAWGMDGTLDINDGTTLAGSAQMNVTGAVLAESAVVAAPVALKSTADVDIQLGDTLQLDGTTFYEGGSYQGGTLHQDGEANVLSTTTLGTNVYMLPTFHGGPITPHWLEQFDWDGTFQAGVDKVTNISSGATLTINAAEIDDNPTTDGYDGTVNINGGALVMNTGARITVPGPLGVVQAAIVSPAPWRLDGVMNLEEADGHAAVVTSAVGSQMQIHGEVNAIGGDAAIVGVVPVLTSSGHITVASGATLNMGVTASGGIDVEAGGILRINAGSGFHSGVQMQVDGAVELASSASFSRGSYQGNGLLIQQGSAHFVETTILQVSTEFAEASTSTIDGGEELQLAGDGLVEAGAVIAGSGALRNLTGSFLTLAGGADVDVPLINDGQLGIGASPGSASLSTFSQGVDGLLDIELGGTALGEFDEMYVTGIAELNGLLDLSLMMDYTPALGDMFDILSADGGIFGMFTSVAQPSTMPVGLAFDATVEFGTTLVLEVIEVTTTPGDANGDGRVDGLDRIVWAGNFGKSDPPDKLNGAADGDYNDDGIVNGRDYLIWARNFGQGANNAVAAPEPGTLILTFLGFVGANLGRRPLARCRSRRGLALACDVYGLQPISNEAFRLYVRERNALSDSA